MLERSRGAGKSGQQELAVAKLPCPRCGTVVNVFPPELLELTGELSDSLEAELGIVTKLVHLRGEGGERFAVRDAAGTLSCPACNQRIRFARDER